MVIKKSHNLRRFKNMKNSMLIALLLGSVVASSAFAGGLSGSVGVASDYVFRGASLSNNDPSIQGNVKYTLNNLTVGATATSVKNSGDDVELDAMINYNIPVTNDVSVDVGAISYNFPGVSSLQTTEYSVAGNLKFDNVTTQLKTSYSSDYFGSGKHSFYTEVNGTYQLPYGLIGVGHIGHLDLDGASNKANDYKLGLNKQFTKNIVGELAWVDSNNLTLTSGKRWTVSAKYNF